MANEKLTKKIEEVNEQFSAGIVDDIGLVAIQQQLHVAHHITTNYCVSTSTLSEAGVLEEFTHFIALFGTVAQHIVNYAAQQPDFSRTMQILKIPHVLYHRYPQLQELNHFWENIHFDVLQDRDFSQILPGELTGVIPRVENTGNGNQQKRGEQAPPKPVHESNPYLEHIIAYQDAQLIRLFSLAEFQLPSKTEWGPNDFIKKMDPILGIFRRQRTKDLLFALYTKMADNIETIHYFPWLSAKAELLLNNTTDSFSATKTFSLADEIFIKQIKLNFIKIQATHQLILIGGATYHKLSDHENWLNTVDNMKVALEKVDELIQKSSRLAAVPEAVWLFGIALVTHLMQKIDEPGNNVNRLYDAILELLKKIPQHHAAEVNPLKCTVFYGAIRESFIRASAAQPLTEAQTNWLAELNACQELGDVDHHITCYLSSLKRLQPAPTSSSSPSHDTAPQQSENQGIIKKLWRIQQALQAEIKRHLPLITASSSSSSSSASPNSISVGGKAYLFSYDASANPAASAHSVNQEQEEAEADQEDVFVVMPRGNSASP